MALYTKQRILRILLSWVIGFLLYIGAAGYTYLFAGGAPAFIGQPIMGCSLSGFFIFIAILAGWLLAKPFTKKIWSKSRFRYLIIFLIGSILLFFPMRLGLTAELIDYWSRPFIGPHPAAVLLGYFLFVFAIIDWPRKNNQSLQNL